MNEADTDSVLSIMFVYVSEDTRRSATVMVWKSTIPNMLTNKYYVNLKYSMNSTRPEWDIEGLKFCKSLEEAKALAKSFIA